jgi:hypothetical protein
MDLCPAFGLTSYNYLRGFFALEPLLNRLGASHAAQSDTVGPFRCLPKASLEQLGYRTLAVAGSRYIYELDGAALHSLHSLAIVPLEIVIERGDLAKFLVDAAIRGTIIDPCCLKPHPCL